MQSRRSRKTHLLISAALLAFAAVVVYVLAHGLQIDQRKPRSVLIGKPAPTFALHWLQGEELLLGLQARNFTATAHGKVLVLNFWASWCLSCRQEAYLLQRLWEQQREQVTVIGIAVHDEETAARSFAQQYGKTYPLGLDRGGKVAIDYGVTGVPETYIIDRDGVLRARNIGAVSAQFLQQVNDYL